MGTFATFAEKIDKNGDGKVSPTEAPPDFQGSIFRSMDNDKDGFMTEADWSAMTNLFGKGDSGLFALRTPASGDMTSTHVAWKATRGILGYASPLFYEGRIYVVQDGGRMTCWNARTGKVLYEQERLGAEANTTLRPLSRMDTFILLQRAALSPWSGREIQWK